MKKITTFLFVGVLALGCLAGSAFAQSATPSTNDINRDNGWAHVNQLSKSVGSTELEFISTRTFASCFEYRTDGDETQKISDTNFNTEITDGLYPYFCVNNNSRTEAITAKEFVEVRMVFGAEKDERFDWTRFDVLYPRFAEITSPIASEEVHGLVNFTAHLDDDDVDSIQWAVREGTCTAGATAVFGNVDGRSEVAIIDTTELSDQNFSFTGDMSGMNPGMYCFIYNPVEDSGESNIRETVEFNLVEPPIGPPANKNQCMKNGWQEFNNPPFKNQGACVSYLESNEKAGKRD